MLQRERKTNTVELVGGLLPQKRNSQKIQSLLIASESSLEALKKLKYKKVGESDQDISKHFSAFIKGPYDQLHKIILSCSKKGLPLPPTFDKQYGNFQSNCAMQISICNEIISKTEKRLQADNYKKKKLSRVSPKARDEGNIKFLQQLKGTIETLQKNLSQLRYQLLDPMAVQEVLLDCYTTEKALKSGSIEDEIRSFALKDLCSQLILSSKDDQVVFNKIIGSKMDPEILVDILDNVNFSDRHEAPVMESLLRVIEKDEAYLNEFFVVSCLKNGASFERNEFLRRVGVATRIQKLYISSNEDCIQFKEKACMGILSEIGEIEDPVEIDPLKPGYSEESVEANKKILLGLATRFINSISQSLPPDQVCVMAFAYVNAFNSTFSQVEKVEILEKIGGVVFLRYLCPAVSSHNWASSHKESAKFLRRIGILTMKLIQNLANNKTFALKEKYMQDFNEWILDHQQLMNEYLFRIVEHGEKVLKSSGGKNSNV